MLQYYANEDPQRQHCNIYSNSLKIIMNLYNVSVNIIYKAIDFPQKNVELSLQCINIFF